MAANFTRTIKQTAQAAGADLVGVANIERFAAAPPEVHPASIFSHTRSVIAIAVRMVRGALKTVEEGRYWQAYNCDSYQYLNEVKAPEILRAIVLALEDTGYTAVPIHNPFGAYQGRPVFPGGPRPDAMLSLRVVGCAAGLGELGVSKLFMTPEFGPRQRMFAVLTDAELEPDPLLEEPVCDECGACVRGCPANAMSLDRSVELEIGGKLFRHGPLDCAACVHIHQGWDPKYSPFLKPDSSRENPPPYYNFIDRRFRHHAICVGRGCIRACMDHLEKQGKLENRFNAAFRGGRPWELGEAEGGRE